MRYNKIYLRENGFPEKESMKQLLHFLYPPACPVCGEIILPRGRDVCAGCEEKLHTVHEPMCMKCGVTLHYWEEEYCPECRKHTHQFERCFAMWEYDKYMKASISRFKFQGRTEYTAFYVRHMTARYGMALQALCIDVIIPVPIHKYRRRERGFNQAELLAKELGRQLGVPVCTDYLLRVKKTKPQKELNAQERKKNLQQAFSCNRRREREAKKWKRILLVDDIYTTGSTFDACAATLASADSRKIYGICVCIGRRN